MKITDEWWTAPTEADNGKTVIVTGRDGMQPLIDSGKYNDRIEITWRYEGGESGMPDEETARLIEQVDEALRAAFKKEKACVLTGVYTGDGARNWIVYTKNPNIFNYTLNKALAPLPLLPIELYAEKDPEWNEYQEMRSLTYIAPED